MHCKTAGWNILLMADLQIFFGLEDSTGIHVKPQCTGKLVRTLCNEIYVNCLGTKCRVKKMHSHINPKNHQPAPLVADDVYEVIMKVAFIFGDIHYFMFYTKRRRRGIGGSVKLQDGIEIRHSNMKVPGYAWILACMP